MTTPQHSDIDPVDEMRTLFWEKMTNLVLEYELYTFDPNIKEMERDLMRAFDEALKAINTIRLEDRIDELKHIDDPVNVYVYWEGLIRPLDRIKQLKSQLTDRKNLGEN